MPTEASLQAALKGPIKGPLSSPTDPPPANQDPVSGPNRASGVRSPTGPGSAPPRAMQAQEGHPGSVLEVFIGGGLQDNGAVTAFGEWRCAFSDGRALTGCDSNTTETRLVILAAIKALKAVPLGGEVAVYTGMKLLVEVMAGECQPGADLGLWGRLKALARDRAVSWKLVEGPEGG